MGLESVHKIIINENHLDIYGHVNNAQYLVMYEQARWAMFEPHGIDANTVKETAEGPVILELNVKFRRELVLDQEVVIKTKFLEKKNPLVIRVKQEMILAGDVLASEAWFDIAILDMKKRKMKRLDENWLKLFGMPLD